MKTSEKVFMMSNAKLENAVTETKEENARIKKELSNTR